MLNTGLKLDYRRNAVHGGRQIHASPYGHTFLYWELPEYPTEYFDGHCYLCFLAVPTHWLAAADADPREPATWSANWLLNLLYPQTYVLWVGDTFTHKFVSGNSVTLHNSLGTEFTLRSPLGWELVNLPCDGSWQDYVCEESPDTLYDILMDEAHLQYDETWDFPWDLFPARYPDGCGVSDDDEDFPQETVDTDADTWLIETTAEPYADMPPVVVRIAD